MQNYANEGRYYANITFFPISA